MRYSRSISCLFLFAVLCACAGGGATTGTTTTLPPANLVGNAASSNSRSVQLGPRPTSAALPVILQITGTLLFPAVATPTLISLSASLTAPAGVGLESVRRAQGGTLTVYEYVTIESPISVSLPSIPAITLKFPSSTPLAGKSVYYGISDPNAQGGLVSFDTQGPGATSGQTVSFAQVPTPFTLEAGQKYTFAIYSTNTVVAGASKIYVANTGNNTVTTYNSAGNEETPTISDGLLYPFGVAVNSSGTIYVTSEVGTLTTYKLDGTRTIPTIDSGFNYSSGVAVDAAGKIYVVDTNNERVLTYNADGSRSTPTITAGLQLPEAVAVDSAGKIYVASYGGFVTTYTAEGAQTTPTISGLPGPTGVAVDASGKIYVTSLYGGKNDVGTVTTYEPNGSMTAPTITDGIDAPSGIAIDVAGKIYVTNGGYPTYNATVTTYNVDGTRTTPTITSGLNGPTGIAVH